jgi:2-polyprenyl-3-methyl-5-hydroxy-6-metoxy-1,4-benzoquinol methylase
LGSGQLLGDRLKSLLRGGRGTEAPGSPSKPTDGIRSLFSSRHSSQVETVTRPSRGLEEFFKYIRGQSGLTILDFGGATQQNVSFITNLGHRIYSENFLQVLKESFAADGTDQSNPGQIEHFLKQALNYPDGQFDAVLIWDVLEYLSPVLLAAVVERLHHIVRKQSYMLAFFHSDDKLDAVPYYTFRIQDVNLLQVDQHGSRHPVQLFNNRRLEKLFSQFESVKFFLTRERLREVIVKV